MPENPENKFIELLSCIKKFRADEEKAKSRFAELKNDFTEKTKNETFLNSINNLWLSADKSNHTLYDKMLPLCELAYSIENIGNAQEHARKLASLFDKEEHLLDFLIGFSRTKFAEDKPFHNACLFTFKTNELSENEISYWRKMATSENMLNADFRMLLPHVKELMEIAQPKMLSDKAKSAQEKNKQTSIIQLRQQIKKSVKEYKACEAGRANLINDDRPTRLANLKSQITADRISLSYLIEKSNIASWSVDDWVAIYERKQSEDPGHKLFIANGIDKKAILRFTQLIPASDDYHVPNITVEGKDIGHAKVYMKKIDMLNEEERAYAACLGKMTNCCQYIGGDGNDCVEHAITSELSDIYVICEEVSDERSVIKDTLLGMTWAWRSKNGALVFDSVEINLKEKTKQKAVIDILRYATHLLCHDKDYQGYHVELCNVGANSGISQLVGKKNYPTSCEKLQGYRKYSDAGSQLPLANSKKPYLFFSSEDSSTPLQALIKKDVIDFLKLKISSNEKSLDEIPEIKAFIGFAVSTDQIELLNIADNELPLSVKQKNVFDQIKNASIQFKSLIQNTNLGWEATKNIAPNLIKSGADTSIKNLEGKSLLHLAIDKVDLDFIKELIKYQIDFDMRDDSGNTPLLYAFEKFYMVKSNAFEKFYVDRSREDKHALLMLIDVIIPHSSLDAKNNNQETALSIATTNGDTDMVKRLIALDADIESEDPEGRTPLYLAAENAATEIVKLLLDKGAKINVVNTYNDMPLYWHAFEFDDKNVLITILKQANKPLKLEINKINNLHLLRYKIWTFATDPEKFEIAIQFYGLDKILEGIRHKDINNRNNTILHDAADKPKFLKAILQPLVEAKQLAIIKEKNTLDNTALHLAVAEPESLKAILESLPEPDRLAFVNGKNSAGFTALHLAADKPESLKAILESLPKADRLKAVKEKDGGGYTALNAADNAESFSIILKLYPETERLSAFRADENFYAFQSPNCTKAILDSLPKRDRLRAVIEKHEFDDNSLFQAHNSPESLKIILKSLPIPDRLTAVLDKKYKNVTILHYACGKLDSLIGILQSLPEADRLIAVKEKNMHGATVLHLISNDPKSVKEIFKLFSKSNQLSLIRELGTRRISTSINAEFITMLNNLYSSTKNNFSDKVVLKKIDDYVAKLKAQETLTESDIAKVIAFMQLKEKLNHLASNESPTSVFAEWENEKSYFNPVRNNRALISSIDHSMGELTLFNKPKSESLVLLDEISTAMTSQHHKPNGP